MSHHIKFRVVRPNFAEIEDEGDSYIARQAYLTKRKNLIIEADIEKEMPKLYAFCEMPKLYANAAGQVYQ